jgi:hypothetical protein
MLHSASEGFQQGSLLAFFCWHTRTAWLIAHGAFPFPLIRSWPAEMAPPNIPQNGQTGSLVREKVAQ